MKYSLPTSAMKLIVSITFFLSAGILQLQSQNLATWNVAANTNGNGIDVTSTDPNVSVSAITPTGVNQGSASPAYTTTNWPLGPASGGIPDTKYLSFTITANPGFTLDLNNGVVSLSVRRNAQGPSRIFLFSSVGGFTSNSQAVGSVIIPSNTITTFATTLPATGYNGLSSIEFRIFAEMAGNVNGRFIVENIDPLGANTPLSVTGLAVPCTPTLVSISSNTPVCSGGTLSLSTSWNNANSFAWSGPNTFSSTAQNPSISSVTTAAAGTYTVIATNGCGSVSATTTVTINASPSVTSSATPAAVCAGVQTSLSAGGAVSYNWMPGNLSGANVNDTPGSTTTYTVTGTGANGCTSTSQVTVTVNPLPTITPSASPSTICAGSPTTLSASGASTYNWMPGNLSGSSVGVSPASTTTYTVTGTSAAGCSSTAQTTVTVNNCSGPQLNATWCGRTNCMLNETMVATSVSGATNYEFRVTGPNNFNYSRVKGNGIANMPLSWILGLQYGNTYNVEVRAFVGGNWQAFGPVCTISMATSIPTTQLTNCAATGLTLSSVLNINHVSGAQDYEFEVTNAQQPYNVTRTRGSGTPSITLTWFGNIQYGRTYNVRVRAMVGGVWGNYGPTCTFSMQSSIPSPAVLTCGTYAGNQALSCSAVTQATNYEWMFVGAQTYNYLRGNNLTTCYANNVPNLVSGTYTVTVRAYVNGQWSAYGPNCTVALTNVTREINPELLSGTNALSMNIYPNPNDGSVRPMVNISGADGQLTTIHVTDITGKLISNYQIMPEGEVYTTPLEGCEGLPSGMYLVTIIAGENLITEKLIIE